MRYPALCAIGLAGVVLGALMVGLPWGALVSVAALLVCPVAMYLGMRQMGARSKKTP